MIIDVTGTILTPGEMGRDCLGNGEHPDIECCCDECDYMQCCIASHDPHRCQACEDAQCPRTGKNC